MKNINLEHLFMKKINLALNSCLRSSLHMRMKNRWEGCILIPANQLNLDLTLLGGQSFRWSRFETVGNPPKWRGVAYGFYWELTQTNDAVLYEVHPLPGTEEGGTCCSEYFKRLLLKYFRIDFDLNANMEKWKLAHVHFSETSKKFNAVRVLDQEPLENILSFICSQNNHIRRITTMIQWICSRYGSKIGTFSGVDQFAFPSLETLIKNQNKLELQLREAKFGYRAKFIAQTIEKIFEYGGKEWLSKLRDLPYEEARLELVKLPGIGFKVADCICLMSLNHLEAVPVDTHIFKIAQSSYMPHLQKVKSVTPKIYEEIGAHFRLIYGKYAGWAQTVLFCADLQQFETTAVKDNVESQPKSKKKKKVNETKLT